MEEDPKKIFPPVTKEESGQKLLQFLERRLNLPPTLIHRWIRTGQIRLNGKRTGPFERVTINDIIRLPPFAIKLARETVEENISDIEKSEILPLPPIILEKDGIIAFNKPAGLPTHPGTGHTDSIETRVRHFYAGRNFIPVPCHRLDRDTSGILLFGSDFETLGRIQGYFREGLVHKEYLAIVEGQWEWDGPVLIRHYLRKEGNPGKVKMRSSPIPVPYGKEAQAIIFPLERRKGQTMLQIRLLTGRTHQIRTQLAAAGYPVCGDGKYGNGGPGLMLHAFRIMFPGNEEILCLPEWYSGSDPIPPLFTGRSRDEIADLPVIGNVPA